MHIFHFLKDWRRPSEARSTETTVHDPLASSFVSVSHSADQEEPEGQAIVTDLLRLSIKLSGRRDLRPCEDVNNLFGELVSLCTRTVSARVVNEVLNSPEINEILPGLRHVCAEAEGYLESYWTDIIIGTENQSQDEEQVFNRLIEFPYFNNYVDLTRLELAAIHSADPSPIRKLAFIGSGPLPLTSLQLLQISPSILEILNIDHNCTAISQSSKLCEGLGSKGKGMHFQRAEAGSCDLRDFDVVYLAALVGSTQVEKEELLERVVLKMRKGAILVIRSAHGLRRVLYAEFDPTAVVVRGCLDVQLVVHPYNHIVNSVIIGRVRGRVEDV